MNLSTPSSRRPDLAPAQHVFRWITCGALTMLGVTALWPTADVDAEGVAATATVCVPGPDNFCPATPTAQPLTLRLYLAEVQRDDTDQP